LGRTFGGNGGGGGSSLLPCFAVSCKSNERILPSPTAPSRAA
jgi:hypothetical protein